MAKKKFILDERYVKVNLTLTIIIYSVVVPFCIYLSVDNFIHGETKVGIYALFCAVMTAIAIVNLSICKFGKKRRNWLMHLAINIQCMVYWITFCFFLHTGGTDGSSIFLIFVSVPVVFFFFNLVYGSYFCIVFFVIMLVYVNTPLRDTGYQFPEVYYSRVPMMYLASAVMCAIAQYEIVKARIKQEDALEEARRASEAKTDFLANTSHEIRTPINAVLGMNEMIIRETDKAERIADSDTLAFRDAFRKIRNYSGNVNSAGSNLLAIINDILDFTKIEERRLDIVPTDYQLSSVLNDVSNMIYFKAIEKNLEFITDVDQTLPDFLFGDVVRVRQVLTNILNNAVKYTDEGSVSLIVRGEMTDKTEDGKPIEELIVAVSDTGIGISEENIGKLFGKFERVDMERNSTKEGTGLGLAITKMLLDMMGGTVTVNSVYGKGSTFTVRIPQTVRSNEPIGNFKEKYEKAFEKKKSYHESFRAPSARILIVDDTKMNLIVATEFLKDTLITIDTAGGGREASELASKNKYDVILMDQRMPEMDGVETLQEIKSHKNGPNIETPVICLTADAVVGARDRYLSKGFNDYLTKPIDSVYLEMMLKKYIPAEKIETVDDVPNENANKSIGKTLDKNEDPNEIRLEKNIREDINEAVQSDIESKTDKNIVVENTDENGIDISQNKMNKGNIFYQELQKIGVDTEKGIRSCGEDEVFYREILQEYLKNSKERIIGLKSALDNEDMKNYSIMAHSLKSTSATIGAMELSLLAQKQEKAAIAKELDSVKADHSILMEKYSSLLNIIEAYNHS